MLIFLAIFLPLACAPLLAVAGRLGHRPGRALNACALAVPLVSLAALALATGRHAAFTPTVVSVEWIPSLGVPLAWLVDGLSLFHGLIASGMGVLVTFYALHYLKEPPERRATFFAYLMFFMGAMLGTVFAANLLVLVVFWELTGVASFLLIGFDHAKRAARSAARNALLVTAGAGLVMLAGVAWLGLLGGTLSLPELLQRGVPESARGAAGAAFLLIAVGAFGKSAQAPLHFWLPQAMVAPTPVSAYLHSATMVNLGVFLVARLYPLLHGLDPWTPTLLVVGFGTLLFGAVMAVLSHDLKAVLAYATISQLGLFLGGYALTDDGVEHDFAHLADHVLYKGGLFMVAGIIDHATGTRDLRRLGGLWRRLPLLGIMTCAAAATLAGAPGTLGWPVLRSSFAEAFAYAGHGEFWPAFPLAAVSVVAVLNVAIAARIVWSVFFRPTAPDAGAAAFHPPGALIQLPPLVLAAACVLFGLWPGALSSALAALRVTGLHLADSEPLAIWGGPGRDTVTAALALALGLLVFLGLERWSWRRLVLPRWLRFDAAFDRGLAALTVAARAVTRAVQTDRPSSYLPIAILFVVGTLGPWLAWHADALGFRWERLAAVGPPDLLRGLVVLLIAVALILVVGLRRWSSQLIALSIVGFLLTFYYVLYRAPDLAMTQILIDSVSLILVLLLLVRFSHAAATGERHDQPPPLRRATDIALSTALGLTVTATVYAFALQRPAEPAGDYYLENSEPLAHARNAVNAILVDFRGLDTLFEITVVLLAALGALGLFMRYRRSREEHAAGASVPGGIASGEMRKEEGP